MIRDKRTGQSYNSLAEWERSAVEKKEQMDSRRVEAIPGRVYKNAHHAVVCVAIARAYQFAGDLSKVGYYVVYQNSRAGTDALLGGQASHFIMPIEEFEDGRFQLVDRRRRG